MAGTAFPSRSTALQAPELVDGNGRSIEYARLSVTSRCNLACSYCRRGTPIECHGEEMSLRELTLLAEGLTLVGISRLRITGGEPLLRKDLPQILHEISSLPGIEDVALTTNGVLLSGLARRLKGAGLSRINISLDTLSPERFKQITGADLWHQVWEGVLACIEADLAPVKINVVVMSGTNEDEVDAFIRTALRLPLHVRFIEAMPVGPDAFQASRALVPSASIQRLVLERGFTPARKKYGSGPAIVFERQGAPGTVGLITPITRPFCRLCNRIRITARGSLLLCLQSTSPLELGPLLSSGIPPEQVAETIRKAILHKPERHHFDQDVAAGKAHRIWQTGG